MMTNPRLRQQIRRRLDYPDARIRARIATDSIGPYSTRAGYMRVEQQKGPSEFLPAIEALNKTQARDPGVFVFLREEDGEMIIYDVDVKQEAVRGANPITSGGPNQDAYRDIPTKHLIDFRTIPLGVPSTEVYVCPGFLPDGVYFTGARTTTLASAISGLTTDYHLLACTYVTAGGNVGAVFSTEKHQLDDFGTEDVLECVQQIPPGSLLSKAVRLYEGQTAIKDEDLLYDLRTPITPFQRITTVQTTDATPTVPDGGSVAVAEGDVVHITTTVTAAIANLSAALTAVVQGGFRRASAGNVTLIGSLDSVLNEDSAGSPTVTLIANTSDQTVDVQVTGVAAQTWNWRVKIEVERLST